MPSKKTVSSSLWSSGKLSLQTKRGQKRREGGWLGHAPIAGDLDLGGMCTEELHVRVGVLEQEGHDESPSLPSTLQLEKLALEAALVVRRQAVCGYGVV
jgi:hypothetical protein